MRKRLLCLMFALASLASVPASPGAAHERDDDSPLRRQTRFGPVVGVDNSAKDGTFAWKGVPFAKPPVGELRWRPPVDPERWVSPRPAREFGSACVQNGRLFSPGANNRYDETIATTLNTAVGSEDCLYLNIWQPAGHDENLPVIIFVHGGSNISGYTADPVYDGAALARTANAVVVTVNYRLGIFGFFFQPVLRTGDPIGDSGNFAMLDILKALEFVQDNIRHFGGNPRNVTLMGQSAGGVNVYAMFTSPLVVQARHKLFHRLVPLSGGLSLASELPPGSIATLAPASAFEGQATFLLLQQLIVDGLATDLASAAAYVASHTPQQMADYLRGKSAADLLATVLTRLAPIGASGSGPIPEGTVLPVDPVAEIHVGNYLHVPVLAGNTREEGKLFPTLLALSPALGGVSGRIPTDAQVFNIQFNYRPNDPPQIAITDWIPGVYLPVDTPVTGFNARTDLLNRIFFIASRDSILSAIAQQQSDLWYYQFDWALEPAPFNDIYGAAHAFDLPFVFGTFGPSLFSNVVNTNANRPGRLALSNAMMRSLGAFARHGDPNDEFWTLGVHWPVWPATLHFDATLTRKVITVDN
jgi:para-nitrobenzyl esterase